MSLLKIKDPMETTTLTHYEMQKRLHRKKAFLIMTMIVLGLLVPVMLNIFNRLGVDLRIQAVLFAGFLVSMAYCSVNIHKTDLQLNLLVQNHTDTLLNKKVS